MGSYVLKMARETTIIIINYAYTFKWHGSTSASQVFVSGPFDNWKGSIALSYNKGGYFERTVNFPATTPQYDMPYKFVVDGHWVHDVGCATSTTMTAM